MIKNSVNLLTRFDWKSRDLPQFMAEHDRLHHEANRSGDFGPFVTAFYDFMTPIIQMGYGDSWHFCPPEYRNQSWEESHFNLHQKMAGWLQLGDGKRGLELGCGPGETMSDIASISGAAMAGITTSRAQVDRANAQFAAIGKADRCVAQVASITSLPFPDASFDAAYAIDAFMYLDGIEEGFREAYRVLKPGGRLLIYGFVRTERPDPGGIADAIRYSQALPPWPTVKNNLAGATAAGFDVVEHFDLDASAPYGWYYYFKGHSALFWWMATSSIFQTATPIQEKLGLLPKGFTQFDRTFLGGLVRNLVKAGEEGVLIGSDVFVVRKPA
jgi:ubiquinone/menaquinone biosynthesis C-methylase UbiE